MNKLAKVVLGIVFGVLLVWAISAGLASMIEMFLKPQSHFWVPVTAFFAGLIAWAMNRAAEKLP